MATRAEQILARVEQIKADEKRELLLAKEGYLLRQEECLGALRRFYSDSGLKSLLDDLVKVKNAKLLYEERYPKKMDDLGGYSLIELVENDFHLLGLYIRFSFREGFFWVTVFKNRDLGFVVTVTVEGRDREISDDFSDLDSVIAFSMAHPSR